MQKPGSQNPFVRLWNAAGFSFMGLSAAFKHEQAFRLEVYLLVVLAPLAFYMTGDNVERAVLIGSWFIVLITELLNSAIEAVVDRFGGEQHELFGRAKDIGSATVFVAISMAIMVWFLIVVL